MSASNWAPDAWQLVFITGTVVQESTQLLYLTSVFWASAMGGWHRWQRWEKVTGSLTSWSLESGEQDRLLQPQINTQLPTAINAVKGKLRVFREQNGGPSLIRKISSLEVKDELAVIVTVEPACVTGLGLEVSPFSGAEERPEAWKGKQGGKIKLENPARPPCRPHEGSRGCGLCPLRKGKPQS